MISLRIRAEGDAHMEPKYVTIKQNIINDIQNGKFKPGDKVYSEGELKKMYNVSSTTVVRALNDLVSEGFLIRRQGEGSFVRRDLKRRNVLYTEEFNPKQPTNFANIKEKTYTFIEEPFFSEEIGKILYPKQPQQPLTLIIQVSTFNDITWKVQTRYVLSERLSDAAKERLLNGASLSVELNLPSNLIALPQQTEINIAYLYEIPNVLHIMNQHQLNFSHSERAFFKICRTSRLSDNEVIEYEISYIQPDYYTIRVES